MICELVSGYGNGAQVQNLLPQGDWCKGTHKEITCGSVEYYGRVIRVGQGEISHIIAGVNPPVCLWFSLEVLKCELAETPWDWGQKRK